VVEHGDGRGGPELGFPTANVALPHELALPADGIYAGWYERPDGEVLRAALSLGRRPTFYRSAERPLLEAHLLDFSGDLYGEPARISFFERLRDERRFDTVEALVTQMGADVAATRAVLPAGPG
jgi:riboflavin kinase/FMN adenylyltransferase